MSYGDRPDTDVNWITFGITLINSQPILNYNPYLDLVAL